jgi:hypothetical protein
LQGDTSQPPAEDLGIMQEVKYDGGLALVEKFNGKRRVQEGKDN